MTKKILMLCIGMLFLASCKKENETNEPEKPKIDYKITVNEAIVTFDNQAKATITCVVSPVDYDISKVEIYTSSVIAGNHPSGGDWLQSDLRVISAKNEGSGKWTLSLGFLYLGKPFQIDPTYDYTYSGTAHVSVGTLEKTEATSNEFKVNLDIKATKN